MQNLNLVCYFTYIQSLGVHDIKDLFCVTTAPKVCLNWLIKHETGYMQVVILARKREH